VLERASPKLREADWQLVVTGAGERRRCAFVYNSALFKASSMARCAGHLGVLLANAPQQLERRLIDLPLLADDEAAWLEATSTGRVRALPGAFLHQAFEAHCAATPGAVALRHRDRRLSYAELNQAANRLAHHLVQSKIGRDDPVVVCVEPGFDIAVALLAIFKAGAVYVPLDPGYPPARIRAILDDTRPALVLTRTPLIDRLALDPAICLALDTADAALSHLPCHNLGFPVDPNQTASVYYTSGTTGQPKGVMASQANLRAYIDLARERYAFTASDVMPAIARFSFSISMFELMSPLAAGGTLVILDRDHVLDLERLAQTIGEVTFFHAGPSLLKNLLAHIRQHHADYRAFARVRHASSGGDMIAPEVLESLKEVFPRAEVFVIYGCSEISCMGCTYPVPRNAVVTRTYVGKPFDNMVVKLFDAAFNPVPVGVVGEIHFAGDGVVKGYLNRPELTAEKFVSVGGRRFYRTGDMGRLNEDGWLEILGRNDFQINVRGMRIEIGEVEYTLRKAPDVRDAVVMAKAAPSGEKILVAYLVPDARTRAAASTMAERQAAVRRHMAAHLPDYMVPASYVELESLPLNHNMKVDRRALPEPLFAQARAAGDALLRAPETPTERQLASMWKQLLALDEVGLDDNLFGAGGQSLTATQFVAQVRRELGAELDGMEVLRESLEVLAALCDQRLKRAPSKPAHRVAARAHPDEIELFHFGPDRSLYGVLHRPMGNTAEHAVLVCAPIGQEHVRTHFVLNRLARQLAAAGIAVLRFDYCGCADSLGESRDAGFERWTRDIADARLELGRRSGALRTTGLGVRLGAALLCRALERIELSNLVLWDPVVDGRTFHAELTQLHRAYVRSTAHMRWWRNPPVLQGAVELLGTTYSDAALLELDRLKIHPALLRADMPLGLLCTAQAPAHGQGQGQLLPALVEAHPRCRREMLDFSCGWNEITQLHEVLPDVGISRALTRLVTEPR
jgi:amino acid adenylation domain-containing protein